MQRLIRSAKQLQNISKVSTRTHSSSIISQINPLRSVLYIPASNKRALEKAPSLQTDAIIFDLEDAVSPESKISARQNLLSALIEYKYEHRITKIVRINGLNTSWGYDDVSTLTGEYYNFLQKNHNNNDENQLLYDGILLPKTNTINDVYQLSNLLHESQQQQLSKDKNNIDIWTMIETPLGVLNSKEISSHEQVKGFILGTNDLSKELNSTTRNALFTSLQLSILSAKAYGKICIDGVYINYKDNDGLKYECQQAKEFGFDGKSIIHPNQISIVNDIFYPSKDEVLLARRHIDAYEDAIRKGNGIAVVDGSIVENLHVERAHRILGIVNAIGKMNEDED